jgi:ABC-type glycerol-3-phosphate transport system permease component
MTIRSLFRSGLSAYTAPPIAVVIPLFILVRTAGLMLTPVAVWLLDSFFRAIPADIVEAASLDGCGPLRTLWSLILPLTAPGIVAVAIIVFILVYNDSLCCCSRRAVDSLTVPFGIALMPGTVRPKLEPLPWGRSACHRSVPRAHQTQQLAWASKLAIEERGVHVGAV